VGTAYKDFLSFNRFFSYDLENMIIALSGLNHLCLLDVSLNSFIAEYYKSATCAFVYRLYLPYYVLLEQPACRI